MGSFFGIFKTPRRRKPGTPSPVPSPPLESPPFEQPPAPAVNSYGRRPPIRVTDERDGELLNRFYSYWSNAWIEDAVGAAFIFAGHADGRPRFFQVDLASGRVERLGPLLDYIGTGEGWYWDRSGHVILLEGPRIHRVNPFNRAEDEVLLDISSTFPGCTLWQAHSSEDGRTHSATVRQPTESGPYLDKGTVVGRDGAVLRFFTPTLGELDESAISANGHYLVIKESADDDNRIIDVESGAESIIRKADGALGHSDNGPDWAVGDDRTVGGASWVNLANPLERRVLLRFPDWNMGHVSVKAGRCLLTHGGTLGLLDVTSGAFETLASAGMTGDDYDHQVMANLDPTGRVAAYVSNAAGRFDVYLLVL